MRRSTQPSIIQQSYTERFAECRQHQRRKHRTRPRIAEAGGAKTPSSARKSARATSGGGASSGGTAAAATGRRSSAAVNHRRPAVNCDDVVARRRLSPGASSPRTPTWRRSRRRHHHATVVAERRRRPVAEDGAKTDESRRRQQPPRWALQGDPSDTDAGLFVGQRRPLKTMSNALRILDSPIYPIQKVTIKFDVSSEAFFSEVFDDARTSADERNRYRALFIYLLWHQTSMQSELNAIRTWMRRHMTWGVSRLRVNWGRF